MSQVIHLKREASFSNLISIIPNWYRNGLFKRFFSIGNFCSLGRKKKMTGKRKLERYKSSKVKLRDIFQEKIRQYKKKGDFGQADRQLSEMLSQLDIWKKGLTVASYHALPGELSPTVFQKKYHQKLKFVFPQMREGRQSFVSARWDRDKDWEKSPWGGWQPSSAKKIPLSEIDVCFVPALAFDREGRRLGRGKGFYDRVLSQFTGLKLGLAHVFQICNSALPEESHDIKVDAVLTSHFMFVLSSRWQMFNLKKRVRV